MDHRTQDDNLIGVIKVLYKWRKPIILTCLIAAVGSVVIALMLPNYYKATTVILASNPELQDPLVTSGKYESTVAFFGEEEDIDRLLTIANSDEIIDFAITEFDLYNHYDIDSTTLKGKHKLKKRFRKLYNVKKDEFGGIELSIEDKDRKFVSPAIEAIRYKIDITNRLLSQHSQWSLMKNYEKAIAAKEREMRIFGDSIATIREQYDIFDVQAQSEYVGTLVSSSESQLINARARLKVYQSKGGNFRDSVTVLQAKVNGLEQQLAILNSKDPDIKNFTIQKFNTGRERIILLEEMLEMMTENLAKQKDSYEQLVATHKMEIKTVYIAVPSSEPEVKSRPTRSILVIAAVMLAFILSVLGALLLENYRDVNWKEVFSDN